MKHSHNVPGKSRIEKFYIIMRQGIAAINKRLEPSANHPRSRHCLDMIVRDGDCDPTPADGCGGCAEMDTIYHKLKRFFAGTGRSKHNAKR